MKPAQHGASATFPVDAAGGASDVLRARLQADILGIQRHRAVFQDVTRNSDIAYGLGLFKGGMGVPQIKELLQVPNVLPNIDYFEIGVSFDLPFHVFAVGAGMHDEHLNHGFSVFMA